MSGWNLPDERKSKLYQLGYGWEVTFLEVMLWVGALLLAPTVPAAVEIVWTNYWYFQVTWSHIVMLLLTLLFPVLATSLSLVRRWAQRLVNEEKEAQ